MAHLEWWKFAVDLLLMGSLAYLCLRFVRSPQTAKLSQHTVELEQTLRTLIRDAEDAGQALNDQLRNRQDALEKVLAELEGGERRVKRLLVEVGQADRRDEPLDRVDSRRGESGAALPVEPPAPEPPSFETSPTRDRTRGSASRLAERIERSPDPTLPQTNIYGEPLSPPAPRVASSAVAAYRSSGARPAVHSIGDPLPPRPQQSATPDETPAVAEPPIEEVVASDSSAMEEVYKAAEQMLRTGKDLHYVSARTELPMEEVRVLKQLIVREQAAAASRLAAQSVRAEIEDGEEVEETPRVVSEDDPRLGVLTAARRTSPSVTA